MSNDECQGIPCFIEWGCGETPLFDRSNLYHYLTRATWWWMIRGTRGKLARNAVRGLYGKGFPSDLVSRTRTILLVLDSADSLEDLSFPRATIWSNWEEIGRDSIHYASTANGESVFSGQKKDQPMLKLSITTERISHDPKPAQGSSPSG